MRAAGLVGTLPPSRTLRDLRDIAWHAPDLKLQRTLRSQVRPLRTAHGAMYLTDAGNFVPENPRQPLLPGVLREVKPLEAPREINEPQVAAPKEV